MEKLLSAQHVADHLGMHVKTLYKNLRDNTMALNFIRVHGRMVAFRPSDVENYLNDREIIRTGSGAKKPRRASPKVKSGSDSGKYHVMTDEEAQAFFANVERDEDGILMCSPDDRDDSD